MSNNIQEKVKPIYSELMGMLSQAPAVGEYLHEQEQSLWERFNNLLEQLVNITKDEDYREFKLNPQMSDGYPSLSSALYRGKASGLISRLHGTFFFEEPAPFSGSPSTVISQTNSQIVTTQLYVQLGIDLKTALDKTINENEKSFIENLMEKIGTVKSYIDFLVLVVNTALQFKINLDRLLALFSH